MNCKLADNYRPKDHGHAFMPNVDSEAIRRLARYKYICACVHTRSHA